MSLVRRFFGKIGTEATQSSSWGTDKPPPSVLLKAKKFQASKKDSKDKENLKNFKKVSSHVKKKSFSLCCVTL